ncbi:2-hydroxymuconate tautomerase [compost metagenome]
MPFITVKILEGKTREQKREFIKRVTEAAGETMGIPADKVFIFFEDLAPDNYGKQGQLYADMES